MGRYKISEDLVFFEEDGSIKICILSGFKEELQSLNDLKDIFMMLIGEGESKQEELELRDDFSESLQNFGNLLFSDFEDQDSLQMLIKRLQEHRFMRLRLRKKHLKDIYMLFREYTKNSHKFYQKTRNPIDLIPDEVKWRKIKEN